MASPRIEKAGEVLAVLNNHEVTTGAKLADHVKVSERTIYRYIKQLRAAGEPILGERGMGFQLRRRPGGAQ